MARAWFLAALGSAALLLAALGSQYLGGLSPCPMCLWQRWPHLVAALAGLGLLFTPWRGLAILGLLAALSTSAIGFFHAGVEQGWWEGPTTCAAPDIGGVSAAELLDQILAAPVVRCDEIAWSFAGLSMAAWNGVLSLALAVLWALGLAQASNSASQ
ncbi:MAG: disulfide bond formation protein B [Pseudomonadota bacterium]